LFDVVKAQARAGAEAALSGLETVRAKATRLCSRCGQAMSPLDAVASVAGHGRCGACRGEVDAVLEQFAGDFIRAAQAGALTPIEKMRLWENVALARVPNEEAAKFLQKKVRRNIEARLKEAEERDNVVASEGEVMRDMAVAAGLEAERVERMAGRFREVLEISRIRGGRLPIVESDLILEADEVCHLIANALYHRPSIASGGSATLVQGRLVATSRAIHFLSRDRGGFTVHLSNVLRVSRGPASVALELDVRAGNGSYNVSDPLRCEAILSTLVRKWKRQVVDSPSGAASRHIPQQVKNAVWQRDGGRCVQCRSDIHLEFDHIIPHAKGGASTENNLQLLCRTCNLSKGSRL
jgi:hypothetical protein